MPGLSALRTIDVASRVIVIKRVLCFNLLFTQPGVAGFKIVVVIENTSFSIVGYK